MGASGRRRSDRPEVSTLLLMGALRTRHPRKERQLLPSLAEHGQLLPVVVVAAWARRSESRPFAAQKVGHLRA